MEICLEHDSEIVFDGRNCPACLLDAACNKYSAKMFGI